MKIKNTVSRSLITLILLLGHSLVYAALPGTLNYQGHLTDSAGAPIDGAVNVTFKIYDVDAGGTALWTGTRAVTVNQGVFSVELGGAPTPPLPVGMFEDPLWIGISVESDAEMGTRRPITTTGYAFKAGDANTLDGISAATLDQSVHASDITTNPHQVTAGQVGALSGAELNTHAADAAAHHSKTSSFPELAGQIADAQIPALIARDAEITWNNLAGIPAGFADNVDDNSGGDITGVTASSGLTGGGLSGSVILKHADTSSQSTVNNASGVVIQDIILDGFGHLTGLTSANLDARYYTRSLSDSRYVNVTGDTMTGKLSLNVSVSEVMSIDSTSIHSWLRWEENGITRGLMGYAGPGTFFSGETEDAFVIKGNTALHLGDDQLVMTIDNNRVGIGTTAPQTRLSLAGTGSLNGLRLGQGETTAVSLYHTSSALRMSAPNSRFQFGSLEYIEDCGANCIAFSASDVGLGTSTPAVRLHINDSTDASLANGSGALLIGSETSTNLIMDNNEIIARTNGVASELFLNKGGTFVVVPGIKITGGADIVEPFDVNSLDDIKAGMVMAIDADNPGQLRIADKAYDSTVAGIVSGANGINPGLSMAQQGSIADGSMPIALTGRLYALADASYSDIQPGDLLTTSNTPGHVMKATNRNKAHGSIIGKAMTPLKDGKGYVLILVSLQ